MPKSIMKKHEDEVFDISRDAVIRTLDILKRYAAKLPIERGVISGVEYIPLRGNAPDDLETLIKVAAEEFSKGRTKDHE